MLGWWDGLKFTVGESQWLLSGLALMTRADMLCNGAMHAVPKDVTPISKIGFRKPEVSNSGVIVMNLNNIAL